MQELITLLFNNKENTQYFVKPASVFNWNT